MPRLIRSPLFLASLALVFAGCLSSDSNTAQAQGFGGNGNLGFLPYGFYQPYGARYSSGIRTPPYFATNPPVYYGARHSRPYGISPFASPPVVGPGAGFHSRLSSGTAPQPISGPVLPNPCISTRADQPSDNEVAKKGEIQLNPFVDNIDRVARK